jgi:hypothetical protein
MGALAADTTGQMLTDMMENKGTAPDEAKPAPTQGKPSASRS